MKMLNQRNDGIEARMADLKSSIAIIMGVVIIVADISWLIIGGSYAYTPWLVLGIVILVASIIWLLLDFSLMREARKPGPVSKESGSNPKS
jgi:hypothetical protein